TVMMVMRRKMPTVSVFLSTVRLTTACCVATRGWVEKTLGQRTSEIDQRVGAVDTERRQDAARIDQQGRRLEGVEVSVREGSERVDAAGKAALDARLRADEVDGRLTRLWDRRNLRNLAESITV